MGYFESNGCDKCPHAAVIKLLQQAMVEMETKRVKSIEKDIMTTELLAIICRDIAKLGNRVFALEGGQE